MSPTYARFPSFSFQHPFTAMIAGPSGSGKTEFVKRLIQMKFSKINPPPTKIIYMFNYPQVWFDEFPSLEYVQGFNSDKLDEITRASKHWRATETLLIIDDLMQEASESRLMASLFYEGSSKNNLSVIFVTQNLFLQSKHMRTISLNSHYLVLFRNPRESSLAKKIGSQASPGEAKAIDAIYKQATRTPFSYLLMDFKQSTPPDLKYLSNVLGERGPYTIVYKIK